MADGASRSFARRIRATLVSHTLFAPRLGTVEEAIRKVTDKVKLPPQYRFVWAGEYQSQKRSKHACC
jgi:cobalt-zinc-cadmium resistance protein CzcA